VLRLAILLIAAPALAAEPVLHVRAHTRVDLHSLTRVSGGVVVRGALVDPAMEEPIAGRTVAISVEATDGGPGFYRYAEPTDAQGRFQWRVPLVLGSYRMRLAAGGDQDYGPAEPVVRTLDVGRRTPALTLAAPDTIGVEEDRLTVTVVAREAEGDVDALGLSAPVDGEASMRAIELPVTVSLGAHELARGRTTAGRVELTLDVRLLGRAGQEASLTARFDGDPLRNPASATRAVHLTTTTVITLAASAERLTGRDAVELRGAVRDAGGAAADVPIEIEIDGGKIVARAASDGSGAYRARVDADALPPGRVTLIARTRPTQSWRDPGRSDPVTLTVLPPEARSSALFLISPLLTALGLTLYTLGRRRPWRTLAARVRARLTPPPLPSGLNERPTRLLRTLRPPSDFGLGGQVCDGISGQPIAGASLVIVVSKHRRTVLTDREGRFALESLPGGTLTVEVAAAGYVSERFERTLPHRGELRGARVMLVPIRARIFEVWRRTARAHAPAQAPLEIWTPRELLRHLRGQRLIVERAATFTALVEDGCFSSRTPDLEALAEVERLAGQLDR
jgi:hypothetical protein